MQNIQRSLVRILNIKMLSNLMYRFKVIPVSHSASYFVAISKLILNFIWRGKRPGGANKTLKKSTSWTADTTQRQDLL